MYEKISKIDANNYRKYFCDFIKPNNDTIKRFKPNLASNFTTIYAHFMKNWLQNKLIRPLLNFLKQGISPQKLAWSVTIGMVLGISPLLGLTTLLGLVIALVFRLNLAAVQLVNYIVYPLQLVLLVPYFQFGAFIFGKNNTITSFEQLQSLLQTNFIDTLQSLGGLFVNAVFVWLCLSIPLGAITYYICLRIFKNKLSLDVKNTLK